MKSQDVIVLGSGCSILDLSEQEIEYINNCEVIIAINKFMAFYKKSKILPTHVYYVDAYSASTVYFLEYIFKICRQNNLSKINFILNNKILKFPLNSKRLCSKKLAFWIKKQYLSIEEEIHDKLFHGEPINPNLFLVPKDCSFEFISHQSWLEGGNWSNSLKESLFHYRGSLSTVLNYISIKYPQHPIKLVGVDFNSPGYFFQEELEKLNFTWQDWTTDITKEKKTHFSAISYKGTTIFDKFDFMLAKLQETGNEVYSCNPHSLLVEKGLTKYKNVIS
ncbi:hypothetical protein [Crocosphaera chwakensis]|uniref:DUF115 domain-containing protein n=1 Tax=Crocosphaera chwakensis CCY0110 TaxID=391612 RepID=A3IN84_9CHRO|nr:hypothetical protein [Crocosphaera chwakensis]EAZ92061.1 hypothetical protein CY0110_00345 [Crocosphaera chwakensis CCY0110]